MSQQPPFPPQGPGYPGGYPQQGYSLPPVTRTSAAAITSLIFGLLGCIPFISGIVAVITGIVGISATSKPTVKGRTMAIIGLILGVLSLLGWGLAGVGAMKVVHFGGPAHDFAAKFVDNVVAGNIDAAMADASDKLDSDHLHDAYTKSSAWGAYKSKWVVVMTPSDGSTTAVGTVQFSNGSHSFQMNISHDSSGALKVDEFGWSQ